MTIRMSKHLKRRLEWAKRQRPDLSERKVIEMALRKFRRFSLPCLMNHGLSRRCFTCGWCKIRPKVLATNQAASGAIVVNVELDPELVGDATAADLRAILDWYITPYEQAASDAGLVTPFTPDAQEGVDYLVEDTV